MASINFLKPSLSSSIPFSHHLYFPQSHPNFLSPPRRRRKLHHVLSPRRNPNFEASKSISIEVDLRTTEASFLLEVNHMMCGACVSRVKKIISSDDRVESAVVNMLTETAAVRLKPGVGAVAVEEMAEKLTECGYEARRRVAGSGVGERVRKWKEMVEMKKKSVEQSRNGVALAWGLVALCCGSHTGHILHSLGIHVAHGISDFH